MVKTILNLRIKAVGTWWQALTKWHISPDWHCLIVPEELLEDGGHRLIVPEPGEPWILLSYLWKNVSSWGEYKAGSIPHQELP